MHLRPLNHKIRAQSTVKPDLRPDAGVRRHQTFVGQIGPVFAHLRIEHVTPARIDREVMGIVHPLHVRTKACLHGQVQGEMHPQTARLGHGVDQARKRCTPRERKVAALGVARHGNEARIEPMKLLRQLGRRQTCGVD